MKKEKIELKKSLTQNNDLKPEKELFIEKIKEYKLIIESNMQQIKMLKEQIKEEDEHIKLNKELENKLHYKEEQIEGLKIVINKLTDERELYIMNQKNNNNNIINKENDNELKIELKEAKIIINNLTEKIKKLEEEKNKINNSEYKSEGEEEYTMKKMVNATKKRNQSEDIKIDYPGLSDMKQKYDELELKYRKLEQIILNLLTKLKCNEEIKPIIIDICNILELGDDMIKQLIKNN